MRRSLLLLSLLLFVPFFVSAAGAECPPKNVPVATKDASAGAWGNLRNNPGSIRYESAQLIEKAIKEFSKLEPPEFPATAYNPIIVTVTKNVLLAFGAGPAGQAHPSVPNWQDLPGTGR